MARQAGRDGEQFPAGFSPVPLTGVVLEKRKRGKPCAVCGEYPAYKCRLHMPVHYGKCTQCGAVITARTRWHAAHGTCGNPVCQNGIRYTGHERRLRERAPHKRAMQAHVLHESGMSWDDVAAELGYSAGNYAAAAAARATGRRSWRKTGEYERVPRSRIPEPSGKHDEKPRPEALDPAFWWTTVKPFMSRRA